MAASFASASSQGLLCATHPVTAYPFTVGLWVRPTATGTLRAFFSLADSAVLNQYLRVGQSAANTWAIAAMAGGTVDSAASGTVTANQWAFMVARFSSATTRRLDVLQYDGSVAAVGGSVASRAFPTSAESIALGYNPLSTPATYFDGQIGEFWYTNTDIQPIAVALQEPMLRQLAYGGPFSVPHIAADIIEYRSLRKGLTSADDQLGEVYSGRNGRQTWTNTASVTIGQHPPLPYWFKRPDSAEISLLPRSWVAAVSGAAAAAGVTYPQLERGIRGVTRGVVMGSCH